MFKEFPKFKQYFVTKEQAIEKMDELKEKSRKDENFKIIPEDGNWYEQSNELRFYLYQDPPNGLTHIRALLFAECIILEFLRRGYDDVVSIAGLFPVDYNTNITNENLLIGYDIESCHAVELQEKIGKYGMYGYGKLYLTNNKFYANFKDLKNDIKDILKEKSININF